MDQDLKAYLDTSFTSVTIGVSVTAYQPSYYGAEATGKWRD
jgi:hypothetical protein